MAYNDERRNKRWWDSGSGSGGNDVEHVHDEWNALRRTAATAGRRTASSMSAL